MDQIWADEGGVMVRFERCPDGAVHISILDVSGREEKILSEATLAHWRWTRAVASMERSPA